MRTRMSGGVTGETGRPVPYADLGRMFLIVGLTAQERDFALLSERIPQRLKPRPSLGAEAARQQNQLLTFTLDQFDVNGNVLVHLGGNVTGQRITAD
jgi:hypothetical protein